MWAALDRWVARLLTLAAFLLIGRLLSPGQLSQIAWVTFGATLSGLITESGVASLLVNSSTDPTKEDLANARRACSLVAVGLSAAFAAVGAIYLVAGERSQGVAILVTAAGHLGTPFVAVPYAVLARRLEYRTLAMRRALSQLMGAAVAVGLAVTGAGPSAVAGQYVATTVTSVVVLRWVGVSSDRASADTGNAIHFLRHGLEVTASALIPFATQQALLLSLPLLAPRDFAGRVIFVFTLFGVASDLVATLVGAVYWPVLAAIRRTGNSDLREALNTASSLGVYASVVAVAVCLAAYPSVLGREWLSAETLLLILLGTLPAMTWTQLNRARLLSLGLVRLELSLTAWSSLGTILPFLVASEHSYLTLGIAFQARMFLMVGVIRRLAATRTSEQQETLDRESALGWQSLIYLAVGAAAGLLVDVGGAARLNLALGVTLLIAAICMLVRSGVLVRFHRLTAGGPA